MSADRGRRPSGDDRGRGRGSSGQSSDKSSGRSSDRRGPASDTRGKSGGRSSSQSGGQSGGRSSGRPRDGSRDGRNSSSVGQGRSREWSRSYDKQAPRTKDQEEYDGPDLPEGVTGAELDRSVAAQLKGLPDKLAARVAKHLAAAGMYIDDDPELAYRHARAARARAPRLAVVREAAGEAAYAAGHYAEALADLRAAKRMNGATAYLPIMADCHRALGHPDQAIKLAKSPSVANFASAPKAEMTIVEAGARRDQGQLDAALRTLEQAPLSSQSRESWVVRLRYAYADVLLAAGREADALVWFNRTASIDADGLTDAEERIAQLEV